MATSSAFVSTPTIPRRLIAFGSAVLVVALAALALAAFALTVRAGGDGNTAQKPAAAEVTATDCLVFQVHNLRVC